MPQYFAIIGKKDNPIYEAEFTSQQGQQGQLQQGFQQNLKELNAFILHASLDIVEDLQWQTSPNAHHGNRGLSSGFLRTKNVMNTENCYLGKVDHFYGLAITAYLTYGGMKLVMIHGNSSSANVQVDDNMVKSFYQGVHELYVKTLMNPFYKVNEPISNPAFDCRVRALARKYLNK
ncbi:TRS20 (YBR254C) [Zygosaccharomyces parabailii]|nr:TRS20 (YBR254C) [Zygosaccharomyces parabailii]